MIKKLFSKLLVVSALLIAVGAPVSVSAQNLFEDTKQDACKGAQLDDTTANSAECTADAQDAVDGTLGSIINLLSIIVGVAAVIIIIVNGFRFVVSAGDANSVGSAKNGIIYAIVGLILVALAQIIVRFVLNKTAG